MIGLPVSEAFDRLSSTDSLHLISAFAASVNIVPTISSKTPSEIRRKTELNIGFSFMGSQFLTWRAFRKPHLSDRRKRLGNRTYWTGKSEDGHYSSVAVSSLCSSAAALVVLLDSVVRHLKQVIVILTSSFCLPISDCFCSVWTCLWQRGHHCCFAPNTIYSFVILCLRLRTEIDTPYHDKSSLIVVRYNEHHFPTQNWEKILSRISSVVVLPTMSPSPSRLIRRSTATSSGGIPFSRLSIA